jgi:CBS-domain-containing membrane protein
MFREYFKKMQGGESCPPRKPLCKIAWSWLGAFIGIYLIAALSKYNYKNLQDSLFLVASFGASAVLVYGTPQAELAQPRNLLGGHIISAAIGVSIYKYFPFDVTLLAALAVSLSIFAMHLTRTLHPPGGATALIAVIGGAEVHNQGYLFIVFPILSSMIIMLFLALFINNLSANPERHYPRYWL